MRELDEGQRKELEAQVAANMWLGRSVPMRLLVAVALVAPTSLVLSGLGYLATDRWFPTWALITGFVFICFIPVLAPEWFHRLMFGLFTVSDADAAKPKMGP